MSPMMMLTGLSLIGITSLGSAPNTYETLTDNQPSVGAVTTVYLGDSMLLQRTGQYEDCLIPKFSYEGKDALGINRFTVKAGAPLCKSSASAKEYNAEYDNYSNSMGGWSKHWPVKFKPNGEKFSLCAGNLCAKDRSISEIDTRPYFVYSDNSLQQSVEYSGRSGSVLQFTYSEAEHGAARPAFTRNFTLDISGGKIAAYKGAIIEVESADNQSITYKVIRNFASDGLAR